MVAEAKTKLLQVQEVIAEREFRVGRFYYLRPSYPAAIARLQSLVDRYPLYSKADEALFCLGQSYEGEAAMLRHGDAAERAQMEKMHKVNEAQLKTDRAARERLASQFEKEASQAYSKILTRYPAMNRADDAKARLLALHESVPRPTKAMLAQNKAEEDARHQQTTVRTVTSIFNRHPDVSAATNVGDPSLQDRELRNPSDVVKDTIRAAGSKPPSGTESLSGKIVGTGATGENAPAPRSDAPPAEAKAGGDPAPQPAQPDPNELKPTAQNSDPQPAGASDPNELKPNVAQDAPPAQAPPQVNELQTGDPAQASANSDAASAAGQEPADDTAIASSKHKKKKGLHKIIPLK